MDVELSIGCNTPNFDATLEALKGLLAASYGNEAGALTLSGLLQGYADIMMAGKMLVIEHSPAGKHSLSDLDSINASQNAFIFETLARGMN